MSFVNVKILNLLLFHSSFRHSAQTKKGGIAPALRSTQYPYCLPIASTGLIRTGLHVATVGSQLGTSCRGALIVATSALSDVRIIAVPLFMSVGSINVA